MTLGDLLQKISQALSKLFYILQRCCKMIEVFEGLRELFSKKFLRVFEVFVVCLCWIEAVW